jgi:hypothetical protein
LACAPALAETYTMDQCMAEMPYRVAEAQKDPTRYCQCAVKHPNNEGAACLPNAPKFGPGWHIGPGGGVVFDRPPSAPYFEATTPGCGFTSPHAALDSCGKYVPRLDPPK